MIDNENFKNTSEIELLSQNDGNDYDEIISEGNTNTKIKLL